MEVDERELNEIEAAALAVDEYGAAPEPIMCRVVLGRGGFVSLSPDVARRLVAAVRESRALLRRARGASLR